MKHIAYVYFLKIISCVQNYYCCTYDYYYVYCVKLILSGEFVFKFNTYEIISVQNDH